MTQPEFCGAPTGDRFKVEILHSVEMHDGEGEDTTGEWFTVEIIDQWRRPKDAKWFDQVGKKTAYSTRSKRDAEDCAERWRDFLATSAQEAPPGWREAVKSARDYIDNLTDNENEYSFKIIAALDAILGDA